MEAQVGSQVLAFQWLDEHRLRVRIKRAMDPNEPALMLEQGQVLELGGERYVVALFVPNPGPLVRSGIVTI